MTQKNKFITPKKITVIVIVALSLFVAWKIFRKFSGSGSAGPGATAVAVEIAPVTRGSLRDVATHTGTLTAKTRVVVAPKIAARLNRLLVDIGDPVRSGQLLALLEDEEYRQQVIQAEADLKVAAATLKEAESALRIAERNLERARTLHQTGIQSDAQLDQVSSEYQAQLAKFNVAEAQLSNREAALANARVRLSYTRISTGWDKGGPLRYVGERFADEGSLLSVNTPILSIVELQPITAVINVTDREYFRLRTGQTATISSTAFAGKSFKGKVVRLAPLLQETSRQARVEIEVDNSAMLLKPGMFVNVTIEFSQRSGVTIVPFNALAKRSEQQGIFLVDVEKKYARFQPVEIGITEKGQVEIIEPAGLSGFVVVLGHYLLETEGPVILPENFPGKAERK
jgi:RND family efflux transporter MFP subunit